MLLAASALNSRAAELTPEQIIDKLLERAQTDAREQQQTAYVFKKRSRDEKLDNDDTVEKSRERVYLVLPINGESFSRLLEEDGQPLSASAAAREAERERRAHRRHPSKTFAERQRERALHLDVVRQFTFTRLPDEVINGRPAYVLTFKARGGGKSGGDRILGKLAGKVWVDKAEFEAARLELRLTDKISGLAGVLYSIKSFESESEQVRLPDGTWLLNKLLYEYAARTLWNAKHRRVRETMSEFVPTTVWLKNQTNSPPTAPGTNLTP